MSDIEWTDETWNPTSGCTRVSRGCDNCYAVVMTRRLAAMGQEKKYGGLVNPGKSHFNGVVRTHDDALARPFGWKKSRRVFVNSMSDLFHKDVPFEFIDRVFAVMALTPQHTYQVLTKRPDRMAEYFADELRWVYVEGEAQKMYHERTGEDPSLWLAVHGPLANVWLGTSVEDQAAAGERIPHLLRTPAAVRFLSCEPLLGPVDFTPFARSRDVGLPLDWVIVGGESGPGARPMNIEWLRNIVVQCRAAWVPVFVKQLGADPVEAVPGKEDTRAVNQPFMGGGWSHWQLHDSKGGDLEEWPTDLRIREFPT